MNKYLIQRVSEPIIKRRTIKETNDDERRKQSKSTSKQKQWSCTLNVDQCPNTYDSPTAKPFDHPSREMKGHRFDPMRSLFLLDLQPPRPFLETLDGKTSDSSNCFLLGKSRNIQQKTQKENTYNNLIVEKNERGTSQQIRPLWLLRIGHEKPNVHSSFNLHHIYVLLQTKMMRDIWILFQILHLKICRTEKKSRPTKGLPLSKRRLNY